MSSQNEPLTQFEQNARRVLEESVSRIDARTRSRLNQARARALEEASARRAHWWSHFALMPAASAAAAALLVTLVLWHHPPQGEPPVLESQRSTVEDIDLLADGEALDLLEGWDGSFYEWAAAQTDANGESDG
jgi:ferric-dicitrate binding protein FerR (iron transport regulator)